MVSFLLGVPSVEGKPPVYELATRMLGYAWTLLETLMNQIALPDLHDRTAEILDGVREGNEEYVVTDEGRPIARLSPVTTETARETPISEEDAWTRYAQTVEEAHQAQPDTWRTPDILDEIRRS
jgi:prevent-host-death family protein